MQRVDAAVIPGVGYIRLDHVSRLRRVGFDVGSEVWYSWEVTLIGGHTTKLNDQEGQKLYRILDRYYKPEVHEQ